MSETSELGESQNSEESKKLQNFYSYEGVQFPEFLCRKKVYRGKVFEI